MLIDTVWKSGTREVERHSIAAENARLRADDEFAEAPAWSPTAASPERIRSIHSVFKIIKRISPSTSVCVGPEFSHLCHSDNPYLDWAYKIAAEDTRSIVRTYVRGIFSPPTNDVIVTLGSELHPVQIAFHEAFHAIQCRHPFDIGLSEKICDWGFGNYGDLFICAYSADAREVQARLFELWCVGQIPSQDIPTDILSLFLAIRSGAHARRHAAMKRERAEIQRAPRWRQLLHAVAF